MNFENQGVPIAIIKKDGKIKNPPILSVSDNTDNINNAFNEFTLKNNDEFQS